MFFHAATGLEGPSEQRNQGEFEVPEFLHFLFEDAYENVKWEQVPQLSFCGIFGRLLTKKCFLGSGISSYIAGYEPETSSSPSLYDLFWPKEVN